MRTDTRPAPAMSAVKLTSISPWSAAITAFIVSFVFGLIFVVGAAGLWFALDGIGIIDEIDARIVSVAGDGAFQLSEILTLEKMIAVATIAAVFCVGLSPLVGLIFAGVYNGAAKLTGGLRLRLSSDVVDQPTSAMAAVRAEDV